jgi:DNA polymerase-3 subunit alpha
LDGLGKIGDLVDEAKKLGMPALALTDHGVMYGAIEFYKTCKEKGIKPIIGVEAYLAPNGRMSKRSKIDASPAHLILLAKNNEGYKNLIRLTTRAHLEGYYYRPRIDKELLKQYSKGLIASTACLAGEIPRAIKGYADLSKARQLIKEYLEIFSKDDFYLEVQNRPSIKEQKLVNTGIFKLAEEFDLKVIATNDVHYVKDEDDEAQDILICVQTNRTVDEEDRMTYLGEKYSLKSGEEMRTYFPDHPEVVENTLDIAQRCEIEIELGKNKLPPFEVPQGFTQDSYLKKLCLQGLSKRYGVKDIEKLDAKIKERLDFELATIEKMGFAGYFLIVQDYINWAKNQGIIVGPGRGSAAGSLVTYLLNITDLDPLEYDLLFERFLNPDRISMPDIDTDFADDRRDEVLDYVARKYGRDRVAQIITFGTMAARAAVRDAGRALGFSYGFCDRIAKLIPMFTSIKDAVNATKELRTEYNQDPQVKKLIDSAAKLEGVARHASTHACAVVITPDSLENYAPTQYATRGDEQDTRSVVTQFEMHAIEDLGLLKMDFLGLKNLTILNNAIRIIEKVNQLKIDRNTIELDDKKTYEIFQKGQTTGVFQFESSGMKRYLKMLKPTVLEDLIAMVALYRPGPMQFIPDYIEGKRGKRTVAYIHPKLEPILKRTYGVAVYQEQIMQVARDLAGFTPGEADTLRKAMGKKIKKLLDEQYDKFILGCVKNKIERKIAQKVWEFIEPFASYGFNRSHAACYAYIAYQTAYLKSHFPVEFMAALLTSDQSNLDRVAIEVDECKEMGIEVLPPSINESFRDFTVVKEGDKKSLRFGLAAIKNVGSKIIDDIIRERKKNGKFKDLNDFLERLETNDFNKKSLESLIKSGATDELGERNTLLSNLEQVLIYFKEIHQAKNAGQQSLFSKSKESSISGITLKEAPPISKKEKLAWEKELLGLYISEHPLEEYKDFIQRHVIPFKDLKLKKKGEMVRVAGVVTLIKKILTKRGDPMLFATLEDLSGKIEVLVFPKILEKKPGIWEEGTLLVVWGKTNDKDGSLKLLAEGAEILNERLIAKNKKRKKEKVITRILVRVQGELNERILKKISEKIRIQEKGEARVFVEILEGGFFKKIKTPHLIKPTFELKEDLEKLVGNGNILFE